MTDPIRARLDKLYVLPAARQRYYDALRAVLDLCEGVEPRCTITWDQADERCVREGCAYWLVDRESVQIAIADALGVTID
jgi:hypothetical protein